MLVDRGGNRTLTFCLQGKCSPVKLPAHIVKTLALPSCNHVEVVYFAASRRRDLNSHDVLNPNQEAYQLAHA